MRSFLWLMSDDMCYCSQICVSSVEDIELLHEEVMGVPLLIRAWAEFIHNDYIGAAHPGPQFEGLAATHLLTRLLTYLLTYLFTYLLTDLLIYLLIYLLTCLLTYLLTYLLTCLLTYLLT